MILFSRELTRIKDLRDCSREERSERRKGLGLGGHSTSSVSRGHRRTHQGESREGPGMTRGNFHVSRHSRSRREDIETPTQKPLGRVDLRGKENDGRRERMERGPLPSQLSERGPKQDFLVDPLLSEMNGNPYEWHSPWEGDQFVGREGPIARNESGESIASDLKESIWTRVEPRQAERHGPTDGSERHEGTGTKSKTWTPAAKTGSDPGARRPLAPGIHREGTGNVPGVGAASKEQISVGAGAKTEAQSRARSKHTADRDFLREALSERWNQGNTQSKDKRNQRSDFPWEGLATGKL
jgi:hypothetical protein